MTSSWNGGARCAALAACVSLGACVSTPTQEEGQTNEIRAGDTRAYVVSQSGAGRVQGDIVLVGPQLEIRVHGQGQVQDRGDIVAVRQPGRAPNGEPSGHIVHDWEALHLLLEVDGVTVEPNVTHVGIVRVGDKPAIAIDASVEVEASDPGTQAQRRGGRPSLAKVRLELHRTMRLADIGSALRITTNVKVARGKPPETLRVIERVEWGGGSPVAPLIGELQSGVAVEADWVGRAIEGRAIVVGAREGRVRVSGHNVDHARIDLLRYTDVYFDVQAPLWTSDVLLSASHAGLAQAVRKLGWARGKPFVEALAVLSTNPPSTRVKIIDAQSGAMVVAGPPDDKLRVILPLPAEALGRKLLVGAQARGVEASAWVPLVGPPYEPVALAVPASSVLRIRVQHAATGEPLPARIRLLPRRNSAVPSLGPDWKASGALDTVISASGRTELRLSPGYYRVIVTHGPEWSVVDRPIAVEVGKTSEIEVALERAIDPGPWVPCELHVHSDPSVDSQVSLEDRVASLVAEGIAFAVPTDHNSVTDLRNAIAKQPLWGLFTVPGVEITTESPNFGHFNAYPLPVDPTLPDQGAPEYRGWIPGEMFAALHALGPDVVVQVNHPRIEGGIGYFEKAEYDSEHDHGSEIWSDDFDALEVWNGFDLARWQSVERVFGDWLAMLEHGHRIVATGSSDSHTIRSEGAGYPRTYVRAPLSGVEHGVDITRALREGRAFVTSGPFLTVQIGDATVGDGVVLHAGEPLELEVSVQVPHWMQVTTLRVHLGTTTVRELPLGRPARPTGAGRRYRRHVQLMLEKTGPLVVSVEGDGTLDPVVARKGVKPFAFTNPLWIHNPGERPPVPRHLGHAHDDAQDPSR